MINYDTNFYLNRLVDSLSEKLRSKFIPILEDAFYARVFKKEKTILIQKREYINGKYTSQLYAYSLKNATLKFTVEIPYGYFLVYCSEVGKDKSMGIICKPIDRSDHYAVEYAIEKNGKLNEVRKRLCTEDINKANCTVNTSQNCIYPVTDLKVNKQNCTVSWKYNTIDTSIYSNENIIYAVYHDFEEVILLLTSAGDNSRNVYLYNLDGSMKLKLELPNGFLISHCPTQTFEYGRTVLVLICHNSSISVYNDLKYMIIPDNGDLVYIGQER